MWPDGPTHLGLKNTYYMECAYTEEQVHFVWFFTCILIYITKNQEECGQDRPTMPFYQELNKQKKERGKKLIRKHKGNAKLIKKKLKKKFFFLNFKKIEGKRRTQAWNNLFSAWEPVS